MILTSGRRDTLPRCVKCGQPFQFEFVCDSEGDEYPLSTNLCSYCFEEAVEEYEEKRRARIARDNEY